MNVLVVLAHPEPRSFVAALAATAAETLRADGHAVEVSDLYAMGFQAVAGPDDFTGTRRDPDHLRLDLEQTHAHAHGTLTPDVLAEQAKIARADLVLLHFPMWWFGPPAILKGWTERVFTRGFAYLPGRKYDTGMLVGKQAMLCVTTGTSEDTYAPDGVDGALVDVLWPLDNGLLRYCGFEVLEPFAAYAPRRQEAEARARLLETYADRFRHLDQVPRLFFHPSTDYGPDERLLPHVEPRSGFQRRRV